MAEEKSTVPSNAFEYAGGEFENDAPYDEALHGMTSNSDAASADDIDGMSALLADLMSSGQYDGMQRTHTCFSINSAASFAAISAPEEQILELTLRTLEPEVLVSIVDIITPVEMMQAILFLELFKAHPQDAAIPSALQTLPTFYAAPTASSASSSSSTVTPSAATHFAWYQSNEKLLMQILSLLGVGLNRESIPDSSASSASSPSPLLYTLLYRGSKVTSQSVIDQILYDLYELLSLPDVLNLDEITKQLVKEMGENQCERREEGKENGETAAAASSSSPSPSSTISTIRQQFRSALDSEVSSGASYSIDLLTTPAALISLPALNEAQLRAKYICRGESIGELYVRMWIDQFMQTPEKVKEAIEKKLDAKYKAPEAVAATAAIELAAFLRALTTASSLTSLLSPETPAASNPAEFFTHFLAVYQSR